MGKFKDLTGQNFGRLTVLETTGQRKQGAVVWKCKCSCGNIIYASRANLEQGNVSSCGCLKRERVSKKMKEIKAKDITGQKFGRLTAIEPTDKRDNGFIVWKCACECGNIAYVSLHNLISKNTLSCGCLNTEKATENGPKRLEKFKKENYIAGTRLDIIKKSKLRKNNTSGCTGVYLRKKDGMYTAYIEFQKKRYFLGSGIKEECIVLRKEAEEKLYGDFLKWYYSRRSENE